MASLFPESRESVRTDRNIIGPGWATSFRFWSWVIRSPILNANFGMWPLTVCRMPGPNSRKRFISASLPIVEPKSLNGAEVARAQIGRRALWIATELSTPMK